ncbi:hypothetical protein AC578_8440 [Pseudocercospora eumusae]|uniref:Uncharacterized protein n=1 Tax=Pseudocercospora eumusae TaxID=321146 RepID=A0A139HRZ6_9PEZI|nr:hypothetical protein AC578_8440 [Pseudocercospora eumusae]
MPPRFATNRHASAMAGVAQTTPSATSQHSSTRLNTSHPTSCYVYTNQHALAQNQWNRWGL